jgi:hypothetical protein
MTETTTHQSDEGAAVFERHLDSSSDCLNFGLEQVSAEGKRRLAEALETGGSVAILTTFNPPSVTGVLVADGEETVLFACGVQPQTH